MKKKFISFLLVFVLVLSFSSMTAAPAEAAEPTTVTSSTMVFEGALTANGEGTYTGVVPMVVDGGYDVYARNGATAWFGDDPGTGQVWTSVEITGHDAFLPNPEWDPDTPDWYQYSLNLYEEDGDQKWAVRNHPGATAENPWSDDPSTYPAKGVPLSGAMDWTAMYATETDVGAYLPETGTAEIPGGAATKGGGAQAWDMDWSWGSEVVPLAFPGFDVAIESLGDSSYRVTMTPAAGANPAGPVVNKNTGESYGTIQCAIDAATPGDIISVAAGTYNEFVTIDKSLTLNGAKAGLDACSRDTSSGESILDGTSLAPVVGVGAITIVDGVSYVTIDGFEVCNYQSANDGGGSAVLAYSYGGDNEGLSNITVQNNYLHNLGWNGVCVWSNNGVVQEGFTVQFNLIEEAPYAGIELTNARNSLVLNNKVIAPTLIVDDPGDAGVGIEIAVRAHPGITLSSGNVTVEGNEVSGVFPSFSRAGINILSRTYASNSNATLTGVTVRGNTVSNTFSDPFTLRGAVVAEAESRYDGPATITDLVVEDNILYDNYAGIEVGQRDGGTIESLTVTGNTFENNRVHIYDAWEDIEAFDTQGILDSNTFDKTVLTGPEGSWRPWIFGSICEAVDWAYTGETVFASAGTYDEQVDIGFPITIQGSGDATVIKPSSESKLKRFMGLNYQEGALWINHSVVGIIFIDSHTHPVAIKDLKVDGGNIDKAPSYTTPEGETKTVDYVAGIFALGSSCTIDNVTVVNMDTPTEEPRTYGMWLDSVLWDVSAEVMNCTITGYNKNAINARGALQSVNIHDNTITGPSPSAIQVPNGIMLANGAKGRVANNTITSHNYTKLAWTACGICLWDVSGIVIEGNNISDCGSGIGLSGAPTENQGTAETIIRGNTITGCDRGVYLECPDTVDNAITGNDLQGNNYGIYLGGPEDPLYDPGEEAGPGNQAHFNNITGNGLYGAVNFTPEVTFDATNNWWGARDGTAVAAMVSGNVTYDPWIGASVTKTRTETTTSDNQTIDAMTEADTTVDKLGTGTPTITVAEYLSNPGSGFSGDTGKYIDVHIDEPAGVTEIVIKLYYTDAEISGLVESSLKLRWWDGTSWIACSDSGVNTADIPGPPTYSGYMWAKIRIDTTPTLANLSGAVFGGGGEAPAPSPVIGGGGIPRLTTNLFGKTAETIISYTGIIQEEIKATSEDGRLTVVIPEGTKAVNRYNSPLVSLTASLEESPPAPPEGSNIIGLAYDFGPAGATFQPAIILTWSYDPDALPEGVAEEDLVLAYYDATTGEWIELEDCVVDTQNNITASVNHFTSFAIIGTVTPPPPPAPAVISVSGLSIEPAEVEPDEAVTVSISVSNTGGTEGTYTVALNLNGVKEEEKKVTVAAGGSQKATFIVSRKDAGSYSVAIDGLSGRFTVLAPSAPPEKEEVITPMTPAPPEKEEVTTPTTSVLPEKEEVPAPWYKNYWYYILIGLAGALVIVILLLLRQRRD